MTIEEIFSLASQRMIEGLMMHSKLSDYFGFLGLEGYQKCHIYHYFEENCNFKRLSNYYLKHYNKLITERDFKDSDVIPKDQFQYNRWQVTPEVRKTAIKAGMEKQGYWEKETKKFYEQQVYALDQLNEIAAAEELRKYAADVDYELAEAEQKQLELEAIDYDISDIIMEQEEVKKCYKKKLKEIELC